MTGVLTLVPLVEGQGELQALPVLLRRIIAAIDPMRAVTVAKPLRVGRGSMLKAGELERYVELAARLADGDGGVLVLVDADDDCAAELGPQLLARAQNRRPGHPIAVVVAVREFEAWFLAAAASLAGRRGLPADLAPPLQPEEIRDAKGWLQKQRIDGLAYSPTVDQPALAAALDLDLARANAPSFDKLWREIERLVLP